MEGGVDMATALLEKEKTKNNTPMKTMKNCRKARPIN